MTSINAIEVIVTCRDCDGRGQVYDPQGFGWAELYKLSEKEYRTQMRARGFVIDGYPLDPHHLPPPEEGPCPECDGTGERRKRITLEELADELAGRGSIGRSFQAAFNAVGP